MNTAMHATATLGLIVLGLALYFLLYIPNEEWQFMKTVEWEFNRSKAERMPVSEVTDFEWDTICYFPPMVLLPLDLPGFRPRAELIKEHWKVDPSVVLASIPNLWSPTYIGSYLFIHNREVVKDFVYSTWGLRWTNHGVQYMTERFYVNGKQYWFLTENSTANDGCIERESAAFKKVWSDRWNEGSILITNVEKEQ